MIDVHCHLNFHKFEKDYDQVISDAFQAGVTTIVNTGTSIPSSRLAVELSEKYENLFAIIGIHPHHADKYLLSHPELDSGSPESAEVRDSIAVLQNDNKNWLEELEKIALSSKKVIGIGEIGMDYWNYRTNGIVPKDLQKDAFRRQIELSIKLKLPLQIHNRLAWDDTLNMLLDYKSELQDPPGMFHCFSGSVEFTKKVLDAGFYLGFDGNITYPGKPPGEDTELTDLVKYAPIDRILTETDSPFLAPQKLRGERNVPKNVILVGEYIANSKDVSYDELEDTITRNFNSLFKPKRLNI